MFPQHIFSTYSSFEIMRKESCLKQFYEIGPKTYLYNHTPSCLPRLLYCNVPNEKYLESVFI